MRSASIIPVRSALKAAGAWLDLSTLVVKVCNQAKANSVECEKKNSEFETHMLSGGG